MNMVLCACGCGNPVKIIKGFPNKYICGHYWNNKHHSEKTIYKISISVSGNNNGMYHKHHSDKTKNQISKTRIMKKIKNPMDGKRHSSESIEKMRKSKKGKIGKYSSNWKGGITSLNKQIRGSEKYINWRTQVFGRDNFTCRECGIRGVWLEAHHIKRFSDIMKEYNIKSLEQALQCNNLWDLNNGITLCKECHRKLRRM